MATPTATPARRPPLWRDVRILRVAFQIAAVVAVVAFVAYLYDNLEANQRIRRRDLSFDFLDQAAGFRISYSDFSPSGTVLDALLVGLRNVITVSFTGIVLTLVLGTLIGIARLSDNWVLRRLAGTYVEVLRNVPPLLVIVLVNAALLASLPVVAEAHDIGGVLLLSVRQIGIMVPRGDGNGALFLVALALAVAAGVGVAGWRRRREERTGHRSRRWTWGLGVGAAIVVAAYLGLDAPVVLDRPEVVGRGVEGGTILSVPFTATLVGLVLYTSSHLAEIVRGSILAVPEGQAEAASALGLSSSQRLRYVVLPQAFRVAVPPAINQFLNLTKNSSLGVAVAYPELLNIAQTAISQNSPAVQTFLTVMGLYLVVSLAISLVANVVNRRLKLVER